MNTEISTPQPLSSELQIQRLNEKWKVLGRARPHSASRCDLSEGYSMWHQVATGMDIEDEYLENFWESALEENPSTIAKDVWEHTWAGKSFSYFCRAFTRNHFPDIPQEGIEDILLHRTPAEVAFIASRPFPTCGPSGKEIQSCQAAADWAEALGQMVGGNGKQVGHGFPALEALS